MRAPRLLLAVVAGLGLAALPFLRYVHRGEAHADHQARHGGQLGMVGEHHVEVARRQGRIEAFVSDAQRRPVQPREGRAVFDGAGETPLVWDSYRLVGADRPEARVVETIVELSDGTRLAISFDFSREN